MSNPLAAAVRDVAATAEHAIERIQLLQPVVDAARIVVYSSHPALRLWLRATTAGRVLVEFVEAYDKHIAGKPRA